MDSSAIELKVLAYWWIPALGLWVVSRCCIVKRAGLSPWLGILWSIPIVGWVFKIWFAGADWPNVKAPSRPRAKKAAPKTKSKKASV